MIITVEVTQAELLEIEMSESEISGELEQMVEFDITSFTAITPEAVMIVNED